MTQEIIIPYTPRDVQRELHAAMDSHRFCVFVAHRRMGKTVAIINQLGKCAGLCARPNPRFAYIGPYLNQSKDIAWDYLLKYTEPFPGRIKNESELWVKIPSESGDLARIRIYGADKPETIKGIYLDGCVIDETADCKSNIWTEVVRPLLSDRLGWCVFIGTPKGVDNLLADRYNKGLEDPKWFAKSYPVSSTGLVSQEELDAALTDMGEAKYNQEYECDFTASSENIFIPLKLAIEASKRNNQPQTYSWAPVVLGVDVARFGDDQSIIYARQSNHTISIKGYSKLSLMEFSDYVTSAIQYHSADMSFIDVVGIGAGVVDRLQYLGFNNIIGANASFVPDNPKYKNKRAEMWGDMKKWLEDGGDIPDDPVLISQLSSVKYKYDKMNRLQLESKEDMKKRGASSPDKADALALTFFMPVMQNEWDEDDGGFYDDFESSSPSPITGY